MARLPGETFQLPSQGLFYEDGELDDSVVNGEVHIYPMTGLDEIIFRSPDKLLSGQAINEVFARCIPQIKKCNRLLSKDVDFLLMALRMITYGPEIEIIYTHNCEKAKQQHYMVPIRPLLVATKMIDPTTISDQYNITIQSGQRVKLRPSLFENTIMLYQSTLSSTSDDEMRVMHQRLLDVLTGMIISVDDVTDPKLISEWVTNLPAGWLKDLSTRAKSSADWGVEQIAHIKCRDCGAEVPIEVPINPINFFM